MLGSAPLTAFHHLQGLNISCSCAHPWYVPGERSKTKLHFLGLNSRISSLLSKIQLSGVNSSLTRSYFQTQTDVKLRVTQCSALTSGLSCSTGHYTHLKAGGIPLNQHRDPSAALGHPSLHAVWLLAGWEGVWMRFIHCNQKNPNKYWKKVQMYVK